MNEVHLDHAAYPCPRCERIALRQRGYVLRCDRCGWDSQAYCDFECFPDQEPNYENQLVVSGTSD